MRDFEGCFGPDLCEEASDCLGRPRRRGWAASAVVVSGFSFVCAFFPLFGLDGPSPGLSFRGGRPGRFFSVAATCTVPPSFCALDPASSTEALVGPLPFALFVCFRAPDEGSCCCSTLDLLALNNFSASHARRSRSLRRGVDSCSGFFVLRDGGGIRLESSGGLVNCVGDLFARLALYNSSGLYDRLSRPLRRISELGGSSSSCASGVLAFVFEYLAESPMESPGLVFAVFFWTLTWTGDAASASASGLWVLLLAGRPLFPGCAGASTSSEAGFEAVLSFKDLRPRFLGRDSSSSTSLWLSSGRSRLDASLAGFDAPGGRPRFRLCSEESRAYIGVKIILTTQSKCAYHYVGCAGSTRGSHCSLNLDKGC